MTDVDDPDGGTGTVPSDGPVERRRYDVFDLTSVGLAVIGVDRRIKQVNPALCAMLSCVPADLLDHNYAEMIESNEAELEAALGLLTGDLTEWRGVRHLRAPGGRDVVSDITLTAVWKDTGTVFLLAQIVATDQVPPAMPEEGDSGWLLGRILAHAPVTVVALDLKGHILIAEGLEAQRIRDRLHRIGGNSTVFEAYAHYPAVLDAVRRAIGGEIVSTTLEVAGQVVDAVIEPVHDADGRMIYLTMIAVDVTERTRIDAKLRRRSSQQNVVADLGRRALEESDIVQLYHDAVEAVSAELDGALCGIFEVERDGLRLVASTDGPSTVVGRMMIPFDSDMPEAVAVRTGHPVRIADINDIDANEVPLLQGLGIVSGAAVPLGRQEHRLGSLVVFVRKRHEFDDQEIAFLDNVGYVLGAAILRLRNEEESRHRALHDELTGLPNRTLLLDRLGVALDRGRRATGDLTIVYVDLDGFKSVNDTLGHAVGDQLLGVVAERLSNIVRPGDTVARLAGDEFAVLCEGLGGPREAARFAQRMVTTLAAPVGLPGQTLSVTASVGVAISGARHDEAETLLRDADFAMHTAKQRGRSRYELFDQAMRAQVSRRLELENDLRRALDDGQLRLAYQPIVTFDGEMVGVEALMRWHHPVRGEIMPAEFVPLAEEAGLIVQLGAWALREACRAAAAYTAVTPMASPLRLSVNISGRQLAEPSLLDAVTDAVKLSGGQVGYHLSVEITESLLMDNIDSVTTTLTALRERGILVAIDDFGTGYSSLSRLRSLPVDLLKIDKSFVAVLGRDPRDNSVVEAVINLAHALDLIAIAEGVETAEQVAILRDLGCDLAQGHYLAPPVIDLVPADC